MLLGFRDESGAHVISVVEDLQGRMLSRLKCDVNSTRDVTTCTNFDTQEKQFFVLEKNGGWRPAGAEDAQQIMGVTAQAPEPRPVSEESKVLGQCEGAYLYLMHLSLMANNEGLAKNLLLRASRVNTAYLFLNERNGQVTGDVLNQFRAIQKEQKAEFDKDPNTATLKVLECDKTEPIIERVKNMQKVWDGRNFTQWQLSVFEYYMKLLGFR